MTDLHTHILPGMDDGAPDLETALQMLSMEAEQGVDTVALTPHYYRSQEKPAEFLARRAEVMEAFKAVATGPRLVLGAEVAYAPGMAEWPELEDFCYEGTRILLVELPVTPWNDDLFSQLYQLEGRRGITPMIAHVERYFGIQDKRAIRRLLDMEIPLQVSAVGLRCILGRRWPLSLLLNHGALLISDCHDTKYRPPNLAEATKRLECRLGKEIAARIIKNGDEILLL